MERVLLQVLYGPAERGFEYVTGNKSLRDDLERYIDKPKYQRLVIDFEEGEDPDDAYSTIPYEKGANLLLHVGESFNDHSSVIQGATNTHECDRANRWWSPRVSTIHQELCEDLHGEEYLD
jgi:hypothetical protein